MVKVHGTKAEFGQTTYEFRSHEDALAFAECVKQPGGRPETCATKFNCIRKSRPERERDHGLEM